ncbi:hypothetical protein [Yoonia sp.]|uniref:hypothetical protein n=1 Tax=Yoonia sp. TaxID=2212373 RepID=UPI0035C82540
MLLQSSRRGLRAHYKTTFWILDYYEDQKSNIPQATGWRRLLRKRSRARLRLILRARQRGFDINETVYLLNLFDDVHQSDATQTTRHAA